MRGEGLRNKNGAKYDQYWGQANSLMYRDEYSGENYCYGDQYIARIGSQTSETGTPETWLKAGINRHMTLVARQIKNYFDRKEAGEINIGQEYSRPPIQSVWNKSRLVLPDAYDQMYLFPPED
jgi:hypothetical protein